MVRAYGSSPEVTIPFGRSQGTNRPHPTIQADVMDGEGNLRAADIGITWEGNETWSQGGRTIVFTTGGTRAGHVYTLSAGRQRRPKGLVYDGSTNHTSHTTPTTPATPDMDGYVHQPSPEVRKRYQPAAHIQRFNNKSLNWSAWFRHFRAVVDVHGWNIDQRVLQLMSYLDETAMNVTAISTITTCWSSY